jgi:hypothetical protein
MQKIEFTNSISIIFQKLKTEVLLLEMNKSVNNPSSSYSGQNLTSLIVESKSNYDKIVESKHIAKLLTLLGADTIYSPKSISELLNLLLSRTPTHQIFYTQVVFNFFSLQNTISILSKATENLFFEDTSVTPFDNLDNGLIIFKVYENDEGLTIEKFKKIFDLFIELIEAISKIYANEQALLKPEIVILDSGSDVNLGIKTAAETAKSLFLIFKEIWDFIVNKKHYENKLINESLFENLDLLQKIKECEENKIISPEESKTLLHTIKTRTFQLLDLNVLPKKLADKDVELSNLDLLLEYKEIKKLKE